MTGPATPRLTDDELATLERILGKLAGPGAELPWPLFRFITEVTATTNADLVVHDPARGVLLAWRDDPFGRGWHVPGSIVRHREEFAHRIAACAADEFGCELAVSERPVALVQIFDDRGHSISLCFPARLRGPLGRRVLEPGDTPAAGDLRWFTTPPDQLYPSHRVYREVLQQLGSGQLDHGVPMFTQHVGRRDAAQVSTAGAISEAPLR